ncbi:hypothetical protein QNI19_30455 [Cytophagaceae bacterium DM2B3-1]|uniref:Uncharacterized protein n=1 Tax=Xanthocytophaga flava TaxID=3048013 RepID=A0ABT7CU61_9BACT|nr:hypothetical protein [Xanthocytophaga flavus]MDJ1497299.1 hypothetical protein [Xanthocytophaga flavus]
MKVFVLWLAALLVLCSTGFAQSRWREKENPLLTDQEAKKRTIEESYHEILTEPGSLGIVLTVWFNEQKSVDAVPIVAKQIKQANTLGLYIPEDWNIHMENGNQYIRMYLVNFLDSTVNIPRIDATVDNFSDYVKINDIWRKVRNNEKSSCGNSYYKSVLGARGMYVLNVNSIHQEKGTEKVKYKVVFDFNGTKIESNEIEISLYPNQLKGLMGERH